MDKKRIIGIDLCKITAMLMICILHYVGHGGILTNTDIVISETGFFAKSFAVTGVNLYMLASGYLLYNRDFKVRRIVQVWSETIFYSIIIGVAISIMTSNWLGGWVKTLLPVIYIEYWYITAYIILLLFMPIINQLISTLTRKQAYIFCTLLVLVFSAWKSLFPNKGLLETGYIQGYGIAWMICMYILGATIRKYPLNIFSKQKLLITVFYFGCVALTYSANVICRKQGILDNGNKIFDYNHIFIVCASLLLFVMFVQIEVKNILVSKLIFVVSAHTLAVYLIQEQVKLKMILWTCMTSITIHSSYCVTFLLSVLGLLIVFGVSILIDIFRKEIFDRLFIDEKITGLLEHMMVKFGMR